jgi:hypothetical protein
MFLPEVLRRELSTLNLDGKPVVAEERMLFRAKRPAPSDRPAAAVGWMLLAGCSLSLGLHALGRSALRVSWLRPVFWLAVTLLSCSVAFLGGVFWLFWLGTDHEIAHANENLFLFPIWVLVLPVATLAMMLGKPWGHTLVRWATLAALLSALVGVLVKLLPRSQDNWMFIAFLLPVWATLAWCAHGWQRREQPANTVAPESSRSTPEEPAE